MSPGLNLSPQSLSHLFQNGEVEIIGKGTKNFDELMKDKDFLSNPDLYPAALAAINNHKDASDIRTVVRAYEVLHCNEVTSLPINSSSFFSFLYTGTYHNALQTCENIFKQDFAAFVEARSQTPAKDVNLEKKLSRHIGPIEHTLKALGLDKGDWEDLKMALAQDRENDAIKLWNNILATVRDITSIRSTHAVEVFLLNPTEYILNNRPSSNEQATFQAYYFEMEEKATAPALKDQFAGLQIAYVQNNPELLRNEAVNFSSTVRGSYGKRNINGSNPGEIIPVPLGKNIYLAAKTPAPAHQEQFFKELSKQNTSLIVDLRNALEEEKSFIPSLVGEEREISPHMKIKLLSSEDENIPALPEDMQYFTKAVIEVNSSGKPAKTYTVFRLRNWNGSLDAPPNLDAFRHLSQYVVQWEKDHSGKVAVVSTNDNKRTPEFILYHHYNKTGEISSDEYGKHAYSKGVLPSHMHLVIGKEAKASSYIGSSSRVSFIATNISAQIAKFDPNFQNILEEKIKNFIGDKAPENIRIENNLYLFCNKASAESFKRLQYLMQEGISFEKFAQIASTQLSIHSKDPESLLALINKPEFLVCFPDYKEDENILYSYISAKLKHEGRSYGVKDVIQEFLKTAGNRIPLWAVQNFRNELIKKIQEDFSVYSQLSAEEKELVHTPELFKTFRLENIHLLPLDLGPKLPFLNNTALVSLLPDEVRKNLSAEQWSQVINSNSFNKLGANALEYVPEELLTLDVLEGMDPPIVFDLVRIRDIDENKMNSLIDTFQVKGSPKYDIPKDNAIIVAMLPTAVACHKEISALCQQVEKEPDNVWSILPGIYESLAREQDLFHRYGVSLQDALGNNLINSSHRNELVQANKVFALAGETQPSKEQFDLLRKFVHEHPEATYLNSLVSRWEGDDNFMLSLVNNKDICLTDYLKGEKLFNFVQAKGKEITKMHLENISGEDVVKLLTLCPYLISLRVNNCNISNKETVEIAEKFKKWELITLDLSNNPIGPHGIDALVDNFDYLRKVENLQLTDNVYMVKISAMKIVDNLPKLVGLKKLDIGNNNLPPINKEEINKRLASLEGLQFNLENKR
ncbi:MAG: protein-tyrosine phosphatase family protein [Parachlamydiales bacterium]